MAKVKLIIRSAPKVITGADIASETLAGIFGERNQTEGFSLTKEQKAIADAKRTKRGTLPKPVSFTEIADETLSRLPGSYKERTAGLKPNPVATKGRGYVPPAAPVELPEQYEGLDPDVISFVLTETRRRNEAHERMKAINRAAQAKLNQPQPAPTLPPQRRTLAPSPNDIRAALASL
jgi:hypothetical protein